MAFFLKGNGDVVSGLDAFIEEVAGGVGIREDGEDNHQQDKREGAAGTAVIFACDLHYRAEDAGKFCLQVSCIFLIEWLDAVGGMGRMRCHVVVPIDGGAGFWPSGGRGGAVFHRRRALGGDADGGLDKDDLGVFAAGRVVGRGCEENFRRRASVPNV